MFDRSFGVAVSQRKAIIWDESLALYKPRDNSGLSKVDFDSGYEVMEDSPVYSLKTSKRNAAYFTRNLRCMIFDKN